MARTQTRRAVSIAGTIYDRMSARCEEEQIPISQAIRQLGELWLRGEVRLEPAVSPRVMQQKTIAELAERTGATQPTGSVQQTGSVKKTLRYLSPTFHRMTRVEVRRALAVWGAR